MGEKLSKKEDIKEFSISDIMEVLPSEEEVKKHISNGYFGFPEGYEDAKIISASEDAFISGCDWMRSEIERKLKGN